MGASAGGITALGGSWYTTKVPGEGTHPCTRSSFATKNVFDVLQDLSESIGGSPGPLLEAADGLVEPITHDLHQSLIELLERPEILSLHAVRLAGRERQLHLKVRALCGEVEKVFDVLVDTGSQVSKEGPYQDRPLPYPFHRFPSLLWFCSSPGSASSCLILHNFPQKIVQYGSFTQILIPCNNQLPSTIIPILHPH